MSINLIDILIIISLSQGFIFSFVLLFSTFFKGKANRHLALSILMISIIGTEEWLAIWSFEDKYYFVDFVGDDIPWILLFYVPMFRYFLLSVQHPFAQHKRFFLLTIPFLIFLILNIVINLDVDFGLYSIPEVETFMTIVYTIEFYLALVYTILLCVLSYWIIEQNNHSEVDKRWLKRIWLFVLLLIILWVIMIFLPVQLLDNGSKFDYYLWLSISIFFYWLTFKGLYQFKLAQDHLAIRSLLGLGISRESIEQGIPKEVVKKTKQAIPAENEYIKQLNRLLEQESIHHNPYLSRDLVAEELGISPGYLSQIINEHTGVNFTTFINRKRVSDIKRMLHDPAFQQYSLLAIGMEAGFKSKSAFYTTFKKEVGMTPSAYQKQQK